MAAPTVIPRWATATGSAVELSGLNVDSITWQSGVISRFAFSASPDLSGVVVGFYLEVTGATNALNNGTFLISAVDNTAKWIEVINAAVLDATQDETGSPATADVLSNAAETATPSTAKQAQGWRSGERPPAGWLNWLAYWTGEWIAYIANGGAIVKYDDIAALKAVDATDVADGSVVRVTDTQWYIFDASSTLEDEPRNVKPTTGPGAWVMLENFEFEAAAGLAETISDAQTTVQDLTERVAVIETAQEFKNRQYFYREFRAGISVSATSSTFVYFIIDEPGVNFGHGDILSIQPPPDYNGALLQLQPFWRCQNTAVAHFHNITAGAVTLSGGEWKINIIKGLNNA